MLPKMIWVHLFIRDKGYMSNMSVVHQDNTSAIHLEVNGRVSAGQCTRHLNILYFYIKDQVDQGWIKIRYCPTEGMIADIFTKSLQGALFHKFRAM